jgi:predicted Zn-dependent peptidase
MVVAASGNVLHEQFVERIASLFEPLPAAEAVLPDRTTPVTTSGCRFHSRDCEQVHMLMGYRGMSVVDDTRYAATLLNVILGGSMSSRLFQEIREKRGLAYSVYSFLSSYQDSGVMGMYAGVAPESASTVAALMQSELAKMAREPVSESELEAARDQVKGAILLASESMDSRMSRLAKNEINLGDQVSYEEVEERFDAVTPDEIIQVAQTCLESRPAMVTLGPLPEGEAAKCEEMVR